MNVLVALLLCCTCWPCIQQHVHGAEQQGCRGAHMHCQASTGKGFTSKLQSQLSWLQALYATALSDVT